MTNTMNEDSILPQGESLRSYLVQPYISKGDLKSILRSRGVFLSNSEKESSIPALTLTLIRPSEFANLQQAYTSKEDNPKITTQTIKWQGDSDLINAMPDEININKIINLEFETYKAIGTPSFYPVNGDPNTVRMDFTIERLNRSKNWVETKRNFRASIEIKKDKENNELIIISTHTAPETKKTNSALSSHLITHLKSKNAIPAEEKAKSITFSDFTNETRFSYLLGLTKESRLTTLTFLEIVDIGLTPDPEIALPKDLEWLKERIRSLDLKGITLEESEFLTKLSYRHSLHLHRVDSKFRFSVSGLDGDCVISISFPEFTASQNKASEIEMKIKNITFEKINKSMDRNDAKEEILKELEFEKVNSFKKLQN